MKTTWDPWFTFGILTFVMSLSHLVIDVKVGVQDIAHFGSLVFGILAAATMWRAMRRTEGRVQIVMPVLAVALFIAMGVVSLPLVR